jgi:hypothetical protein
MAGRRLAIALPWCYFPAIRRHLQRPSLAQIRPYPYPRQKNTGDADPVLGHESF